MTNFLQRSTATVLAAVSVFLTGCSATELSTNIPLSYIDVPENVDLVVAVRNSDFIKQKFAEAKAIATEDDPIAEVSIDDFEYAVFIADVTNYSITGFMDVRNYCVKALYKDSKELVNVPIPEMPNGNSFCEFDDSDFEKNLQEKLNEAELNLFVHASTKKIRELTSNQFNSYKPLFKDQFLKEVKSQADTKEFERAQKVLSFLGINTPIDSENFIDEMVNGIQKVHAAKFISHLDSFQISIKANSEAITWHNSYQLTEGIDTEKIAQLLTDTEKGREIILSDTTEYSVTKKVDGQNFAIQAELKNYDLSAGLYAYSSPTISFGVVGAIMASAAIPTAMVAASDDVAGTNVLSQIGILDSQGQARDASRKANAAMMIQAIEALNADIGSYPAERGCVEDIAELSPYFPGENPISLELRGASLKIDGCHFLYDPITDSEDQNYAIYTTVEVRENGNTKEVPAPGDMPKISRVGGQYYVIVQ